MATAAIQLDLAELNEPEAVAGVLKVSKNTVYRLVRTGELFAYKVGSQIRIPAFAVYDYLGAQPAQLPEPAAA